MYMYNDFVLKNPDEKNIRSYETYRKTFKTQNIGFGQPAEDQCETCLIYHVHNSDKGENHDLGECEV